MSKPLGSGRHLLLAVFVLVALLLSAPVSAQDHPLAGQTIDMAILGIGGWLPSSLGVEMAVANPDTDFAEFAEFAQANYGYTANFSFQESPFESLFQRAAASLATRSNEFNIIVSDSQWLGAFAEPGWIINITDLINNGIPDMGIDPQPNLDITPYSSVVRTTYQIYPDGSDQVWGLPQEGDVIVLFVRTDIVNNPDNMAAFEAENGFAIPTTFEEWEGVTMEQFETIAKFFTRPDDGVYGTVMQHSRVYDFQTMYLYPFMFSQGGDIWNPETREVYGILNSDINAAAMEWNKRMLDYEPPGAVSYGIAENIDAFTQGTAATAFQWAAVGLSMVADPEIRANTMIVPPPAFMREDGSLSRVYSMGGQPWVVNAFNSPEQMRVAVDFLNWWYLPETQLEYARRGGNPTDADTLNNPDFDTINPWNRAFRYMLQPDRARDFWHEPNYSEMLSAQQEGFTAYVSGQVSDAANTLEWIACQQQKTLYDNGRSDVAPPDSCNDVSLN
ncbi:MAG: extracellular solute-binding protein [Anaerolineae bacterium]|nr:extracellular solute-binding protein [Anaerolineae bacterium]